MTPTLFPERELATVLAALRLIQQLPLSDRQGFEHYQDPLAALNNAEIDALCEKLNALLPDHSVRKHKKVHIDSRPILLNTIEVAYLVQLMSRFTSDDWPPGLYDRLLAVQRDLVGSLVHRIRTAVEDADQAFWNVIASHFPEVTHDGLFIDEVCNFSAAEERIVTAWYQDALRETLADQPDGCSGIIPHPDQKPKEE